MTRRLLARTGVLAATALAASAGFTGLAQAHTPATAAMSGCTGMASRMPAMTSAMPMHMAAMGRLGVRSPVQALERAAAFEAHRTSVRDTECCTCCRDGAPTRRAEDCRCCDASHAAHRTSARATAPKGCCKDMNNA
ncbi:hypothetical protein OG440_39435 (plasmid) [Streptomyces sp. NBC_00637]|uniref:hypothetical protein n=1 Tax=Streptomyces sp. NBC_00637 TaxID=2903667 RepID=UPI002F90F7C5